MTVRMPGEEAGGSEEAEEALPRAETEPATPRPGCEAPAGLAAAHFHLARNAYEDARL